MQASRKMFVAILAMSVLTAISVCELSCSRPQTPQAAALTHVHLRLLWVHQAQFAGYYAAKEAGALASRGIDAEIDPGGPEVNAVKLVGSGAEEFGICSATDIILARSNSVPVKALAIVVKDNPTCFFARADSNIHTVQDFKGKRVGVKVGREVEYYLKAMLEYAHVNESDVQQVPIQFDMTPFFQKQIDVWCGYRINEPIMAREHGIDVIEILPSDYGVVAAGDVIFTSESFYKDHPDLCRNFVDGCLEGWRAARDHPDQAIGYVLKYNPQADKGHETAMLASMIKLVFPNGRDSFRDQTDEQWAAMINFLRKYESISADLKPADCFWNLN